MESPVLVEVLRGTLVESRHRGAAVVVDRAGAVVLAWGDIERPIYARSAVKPLQALPLVESGAADALALTPRELALACSSHHGEEPHVTAIAAWLARAGLGVADLACGAHPPLDPAAARALVRAGEAPSALHNNCSGKHAGFLTTARHLGEPVARLYRRRTSGAAPRDRGARRHDRARSRRMRRAASTAAAFP